MKNVWTWGGEYFGYIIERNLFTVDGKNVGRFFDNEIYAPNGSYLGELRDMSDNRLITQTNKKSRTQYSYLPLAKRMGQIGYTGYVGRAMYSGCEDFPRPNDKIFR